MSCMLCISKLFISQCYAYTYISAVDDGQGYLLLTSGSRVLQLGSEIIDTLKPIYNTSGNNTITGVYILCHILRMNE